MGPSHLIATCLSRRSARATLSPRYDSTLSGQDLNVEIDFAGIADRVFSWLMTRCGAIVPLTALKIEPEFTGLRLVAKDFLME